MLELLTDFYTSDFMSELFFFKSEVSGDEVIALAAIRAKVYSLIYSTGNGEDEIIEIRNKLKGLNRSCVDMIGNIFIMIFIRYLYTLKKSNYMNFQDFIDIWPAYY